MSERPDNNVLAPASACGMWNKDGKDGPSDPNSSMGILLRWLLTPGNYARYRGPQMGQTKLKICGKIADVINSHLVKVPRDARGVKNKLDYLVATFNKAHDFATKTGAGLKETDVGTFRDAVTKICPYYFEMLPVMGDRASAMPMTNEMLFGERVCLPSKRHNSGEVEGTWMPSKEMDESQRKSDSQEAGGLVEPRDLMIIFDNSDSTSAPTSTNREKSNYATSKRISSEEKNPKKHRSIADPVYDIKTLNDEVYKDVDERDRRYLELDYKDKELQMKDRAQQMKQRETMFKVNLVKSYQELVNLGMDQATIYATLPEVKVALASANRKPSSEETCNSQAQSDSD